MKQIIFGVKCPAQINLGFKEDIKDSIDKINETLDEKTEGNLRVDILSEDGLKHVVAGLVVDSIDSGILHIDSIGYNEITSDTNVIESLNVFIKIILESWNKMIPIYDDALKTQNLSDEEFKNQMEDISLPDELNLEYYVV